MTKEYISKTKKANSEVELTPDSNIRLIKISNPTHGALEFAGIKKFKDLEKFTEKEIAKLHGVGPSTFVFLKPVMKKLGISFKKS